MEENKVPQFYLDEESLGLIVEALLVKIKENVNGSLTSNGLDSDVWENLLSGLVKGIVDPKDVAIKGVSLELLAAVISKGGFLSYKPLVGKDITTLVTDPATNVIYLLKDPDDEENNVSVWMYTPTEDGDPWLHLAGIKVPQITFVDTEGPDDINNIVAHVRRGETDFSGSDNVHSEEIVNAQVLTEVLVKLGYSSKIVINFDKGQGRPITEVVGKPAVNAFYVYQQSADENDWAVYTAAPIINTVPAADEDSEPTTTTKYVWLKISGAQGSAPVEIDMSNYWSKDELKPLTADVITSAVEAASEKVGI